MKNIIEELEQRGLLKQITNEEKILNAQKNNKALYCGFDPTADSLHQYGFKPIAILGGGTGMIGDPSFKAAERKLLTLEDLENNVKGIKKQLESLIGDVQIINNND
ncbi:hypothetical protein FQR65_LT17092 [Abscondita terminalis]|nr:hypothetical protein FQR65_LT17092 [Abscondita terminalis]